MSSQKIYKRKPVDKKMIQRGWSKKKNKKRRRRVKCSRMTVTDERQSWQSAQWWHFISIWSAGSLQLLDSLSHLSPSLSVSLPYLLAWLSLPPSLTDWQFRQSTQNVQALLLSFSFKLSTDSHNVNSVHTCTPTHQLRNTTNNLTIVVNNLGDRLIKDFIALAWTYLKCQHPRWGPQDLCWHPPPD